MHLCSFCSLQPREQHGSPAGLLETSEKICPGFSFLLGLLKPAESNMEIRPQYVPSVFLPVHKTWTSLNEVKLLSEFF